MDQTADTNSTPVPSSVSGTTPQNSAPSSGKSKLGLYILVIILAAGLGIGGYFLGAYVQSKKVPVSTTTQEATTIPSGFTKAQDLIAAGGNFVAKSGVQIVYNGVLTAVDPGRGWTLKKGGKTVTVKQGGTQDVKYSKIAVPNTPAQVAMASDLTTGDSVTLITLVDTKTGLVTVTNIIITPKPGAQATPSASPATQKP